MQNQSKILHDREINWLIMSMIKHDCADDADSNEQWRKTVDSSADWIHRSQLELKSIQTLTETAAWSADVGQADEQHDDDDDQNDTVHWMKLI